MTLKRKGKGREFYFRVSGDPLQHKEKKYVILTLEDITELNELRRILPICSFCRIVRDDSDYWQEVEDYFLKFSNIRFSHGVCPECAKKQYSEFQGD